MLFSLQMTKQRTRTSDSKGRLGQGCSPSLPFWKVIGNVVDWTLSASYYVNKLYGNSTFRNFPKGINNGVQNS